MLPRWIVKSSPVRKWYPTAPRGQVRGLVSQGEGADLDEPDEGVQEPCLQCPDSLGVHGDLFARRDLYVLSHIIPFHSLHHWVLWFGECDELDREGETLDSENFFGESSILCEKRVPCAGSFRSCSSSHRRSESLRYYSYHQTWGSRKLS